MNFKSLVAQLANRINQPHVIEIYMRKVFASGVEWQICGLFILFDFIFYTATNVVYSILKLMFF